MSKCLRMSASCINCFKQCKMRFRNQYMLGLQPTADSDALRIGSVYHACREIIGKIQSGTTKCWGRAHRKGNDLCPICGNEALCEDPIQQVMVYLDNYYELKPEWDDVEKMLTERSMLLNAMVAYQWRYNDDANITMLGTEFKAEQKLFNPYSGDEVDDAVLVYVCDGIMKMDGEHAIREYKTTSKGVDADSTFWNNLKLAIQPNMYIYCLDFAQRTGMLKPLGIMPEDKPIRSIMYDVFHKPGIKPKNLSQGESKSFVETGEYMGVEFEVETTPLLVDHHPATVTPGKKEGTFAIRETPEMYGARLLDDITERPDFYLARRMIEKTDADLARTERQLFNIYQSIRNMEEQNSWYTEEESCEATFKCPYLNLCYNNVDVPGELAAGRIPDGFRVYVREETK